MSDLRHTITRVRGMYRFYIPVDFITAAVLFLFLWNTHFATKSHNMDSVVAFTQFLPLRAANNDTSVAYNMTFCVCEALYLLLLLLLE